jgi:hypothetical protein
MFSRNLLALGSFLLLCLFERQALAQACCAGSNAITPARLGPHEDVLVGVTMRTAYFHGSYDSTGNYLPTPSRTSEYDLQESFFIASRVSSRVQVALLAPLVETYRKTRTASESGGGLGDLNFSGRYDVLRARESLWIPGIGILAGLTVPTGRAAEAARNPLATDATGTGSAQVNLGLALERAFGPWLLGGTGIVAWRTSRTVHDVRFTAASQLTLLGSASYSFDSGAGLGAAISYATEGDMTVNDRSIGQSSVRLLTGMLSGVMPFSDNWRGVALLSLAPPVSGVSKNQTAAIGATFGMIWTYP